MKIVPGDFGPQKPVNAKTKESKSKQGTQAASEPSIKERSEIRERMIHVQRTLSRSQTILSGLEGVRSFAQRQQEDLLDRHIQQTQYNREAVLMPLKNQLLSIVRNGDLQALETLIEQELTSIRSVSADLARFSVAEQNARALDVEGDTLRDKNISFNLFRENIIDLLS